MSTPDSTPKSAPNSAPADGPAEGARASPPAAMVDRELLTLRKLAAAIGVDAGQLSKESSRPGFPAHQTEKGVVYDPGEVAAWRTVNVRQKSRKPSPPATSPAKAMADPQQVATKPIKDKTKPAAASPAKAMAAAVDGEDDEFVTVLRSGKASALEISRASVQILARNLARAHVADLLGPNAVDGLKKALQELRSAEADYIELEKTRGGLIARDEVRQIVGDCAGRLLQIMNRLENTIATEFAIWLADPKIQTMPADERARLVRGFVAKQSADLRRIEADQVDSLIDQAKAQGESS